MRKLMGSATALAFALISATAIAETRSDRMAPASTLSETLTTLPTNAVTVNNWLKQNVYDPSGAKIGEVEDILVSDSGRLEAAIVSVGGFIGINEKDVAVPFSAIQAHEKNGKWQLMMNTTKEALKSAPGFKFDRTNAMWKTS